MAAVPFNVMTVNKVKIPEYPHFDAPLSHEEAAALVSDPYAVSKHNFLPLLKRSCKRQVFRKSTVQPAKPPREILYACRRDTVIFRAYRAKLAGLYEHELESHGLLREIIAYRTVEKLDGTPMSTIDFAVEAFAFIQKSSTATIFCLDISKFFDNISHSTLIGTWKRLTGHSRLSDDDFAVLKAATKFRYVEERSALTALGYFGVKHLPDGTSRPGFLTFRKFIHKRLCSLSDFKSKIIPLVKQKHGSLGIAQGIPLSDVLANASLLPFDLIMKQKAESAEGIYRRYSDDILLVIPNQICDVEQWVQEVRQALCYASPSLELSATKNAVVHSKQDGKLVKLRPEAGFRQVTAVEYLGLTYNGSHVALRDATISRLRRKIVVRVRKHVRGLIRAHPAETRMQIENRLRLDIVLNRFDRLSEHQRSMKGKQRNFRTYAKTAQERVGLDLSVILKQLSGHKAFIRKRAKIELDRVFP